MFLGSVAFLSAAELSWEGAALYGRHEMNRGVFKMDKIEPKPGKLWERTKHWTTEDTTLGGGALGIFAALSPRALPGAVGFSRFLGAVTVGCALGSEVGKAVLVRVPPQHLKAVYAQDTAARHKEYEKLEQNAEAKASLSRVGKFALSCYASPVLRILHSPLQFGGLGGTGGHQHGPPGSRPLSEMQAELARSTVIRVEFTEGELTGPDVEDGFRVYKDDIKSRDASSIQDWLERLQALRKKLATELQYVWPHLAEREREFYKIEEEDKEKDIVRRELQLLNNTASDLASQHAILAYHENDARKRLEQLKSTDTEPVTTTSYETPSHSAASEQEAHYGPHIITERVRTNWSRQKELLAHIEHALSQYAAISPEEGTSHGEASKQLKKEAEQLKLNVEATERLLRWCEQQVREADEPRNDGGIS
jgi:hypothetical protein